MDNYCGYLDDYDTNYHIDFSSKNSLAITQYTLELIKDVIEDWNTSDQLKMQRIIDIVSEFIV